MILVIIPTRTVSFRTLSVTQAQAAPKGMKPRGRLTAQKALRQGGRPRSDLGQRILSKLADHPEGLSAEELRVHVQAERPIGDILAGMKKRGDITMLGQGRQVRYVLA